MRNKLLASVAVALLGMGVTTAFASSSPYQAVVDAAPILASDGNALLRADATDITSGSMLAALVHANNIGAASVATQISALANGIITNVDSFASPTFFTGDESWGLARTGQAGIAISASYEGTAYTNATTLMSDFYNTYVPANGGTALRAATVVSPTSDPIDPDAIGIFQLSHHVLASDLIGSPEAATYRSTLATALGNLNVVGGGGTDAGNEGAGDVSTTQALAVALWALQTTGITGSDLSSSGPLNTPDVNDSFSAQTLAALKTILIGRIDVTTTTFFQRLDSSGGVDGPGVDPDLAVGYAEDLAYGILALKAFSNPADAALIASLEQRLAIAVSATFGTPLNVVDDTPGYNAQYSGAAIQALPEPATLSLIALGGLGLLARRRRI